MPVMPSLYRHANDRKVPEALVGGASGGEGRVILLTAKAAIRSKIVFLGPGGGSGLMVQEREIGDLRRNILLLGSQC